MISAHSNWLLSMQVCVPISCIDADELLIVEMLPFPV